MTLEFTSPAGIVMAVALFVVFFATVIVGSIVILFLLYWAFVEVFYKYKKIRSATWYFLQYIRDKKEFDNWILTRNQEK